MPWKWPASYDRAGAIELARARGARMAARRKLRPCDAEDLIQEAQTALLAAWPLLVERYALPSGRVEGGLIAVAVDDDLIDYTRKLLGRGKEPKPHVRAVPLARSDGSQRDVRADDDTEYEALRHLDDEPLDVIIERLVARERGSEHTKDLLRRVFRRLAAGADEHELGSELGYTRSHIQMVLARYRKHAGRWL